MKYISNCKLKAIFIILLILSFYQSKAQIIYDETNSAPKTLQLKNYTVTEKVYNKKTLGSNYLYEDWQLADVKMTIDSVIMQDLYIKVDILNNIVEIKDITEIKILPANLCSFFILKEKNETYITKNVVENCSLNGFSQLLFNGKTALICNYSAKVKRSNYNELLNVGNRDDEIIFSKTYYLYTNKQLSLVETNKKKFLLLFKDSPDLQNFIKEKNISPKSESDLIQLLTYINSNL